MGELTTYDLDIQEKADIDGNVSQKALSEIGSASSMAYVLDMYDAGVILLKQGADGNFRKVTKNDTTL